MSNRRDNSSEPTPADIVIFGAGAIGRGLLGDIAWENKKSILFVEAFPQLVETLGSSGFYRVNLTGRKAETHQVDHYRIVNSDHIDQTAQALADCEFAATAVGGGNLPGLAAMIKSGLERRSKSMPLNILLCENCSGADALLTGALLRAGADRDSFSCIPCSVERMAGGRPDGSVTVEYGQSLHIDANRWLGAEPDWAGFHFCRDLEFYYKRKLYTNNAGHALLAYMGHLAGYEFLYESIADNDIYSALEKLLAVASEVMVHGYGASPDAMRVHIGELLNWRFPNRELADTVKRVARDPMRKLAADERLIGLLRAASSLGLATEPITDVIGCALCFRDPDDPQSLELQDMIAKLGPETVLERVCSLTPAEPAYRQCLESYQHGKLTRSRK